MDEWEVVGKGVLSVHGFVMVTLVTIEKQKEL